MFIYPVSKYLKITQIYWASHLGLDFGWNDGAFNGQPIVAIADGTVVGCADGYGNTYPSRRIYGNYVNIDHGDGFFSIYGHLKIGLTVKKGEKVKQGQVLGYMGNSGYSNGQHLHFELRKGLNVKANSIDPMDYLFVNDPSIYVNPNSKWYDRIRYEISPITPVERDPSHDQVEVALDILNVRSGPSTSYNRLGFAERGFYDVLSATTMEKYIWYEVEPDKWIAGVESVTYLPASLTRYYSVLFPKVSEGDKNSLVKLADGLALEVEVTEI